MRQRVTLASERARPDETGDMTFECFAAVHLLGSSGVLLRGQTQSIFYTGDVNFDDQTVMQSAVFPEEGVDILIMECTRGDHETPSDWTREGEEHRFAEAIRQAFDQGG